MFKVHSRLAQVFNHVLSYLEDTNWNASDIWWKYFHWMDNPEY